MKKDLVFQIIICLLILLFVYTAVSKLADYNNFLFVLRQTDELRPFAAILSIALPLVEIVVAVLLIIPSTRHKGLYTSLILMSVFTIYVAYVNFLASHRPCACGGVLKGLKWRQHLIFNIIFTLIALAGIWLNKTLHQQDNVPLQANLEVSGK
ncbi:MauE/DoxX family redox-associated membrane protein [Puia dinghuensis]|uniref:Methylamine utilisation protein MauE domain-containing protein n=1 Tax=Puia dinghuensis TaxID=1792502 RepID=A0A8J2XX24_9BACT|nr:MauE/DoxX family redox-associated membrane protein [Puia dinghuensis]GGB23756.1 hypothetical protein GCM10011511_54520 [Puia dinghuensis]